MPPRIIGNQQFIPAPHRPNFENPEATPLAKAKIAISMKYESLGRGPGEPRGEAGPLADGYVRDYAHGRIYFHPRTGAHLVYGDIGARYTALGGPNSWLGWPTSDEGDFDGGRASMFERGAIYWWGDTGAIELGHVLVRYTGLHCFGTTGHGPDDPFVWLGVVPPPPDVGAAVKTQIHDNVDARQSVPEVIELYRGLPLGLGVSCTFFERDAGNANEHLPELTRILLDIAEAAEKLEDVPWIGDVARILAKALRGGAEPIARLISDVFGMEDDHIATVMRYITPKEMVTRARAPRIMMEGIECHFESPLAGGDGGSYKAYFDVLAV
jgi:hypothetical protein